MLPHTSTPMTIKRIRREIADLQREDMGDIALAPSDDNLLVWKASLPGPAGSPYERGVFKLSIELPPDYPFTAPKVTFLTRIYHMNISDRGGVCIDLLKHNWSPALSLYKVLLSLSSLLTDPNPHDPLVPPIAHEYLKDRNKHDSTARDWTQLYAIPVEPVDLKAAEKSSENATTRTVRKGKAKLVEIDLTAGAPSSSGSTLSTESRTARSDHNRENIEERCREPDATITVLSDSDDDESAANIVRSATLTGSKRKRTADSAVARNVRAATRSSRRKKGEELARGATSSSSVSTPDDVIVIED